MKSYAQSYEPALTPPVRKHSRDFPRIYGSNCSTECFSGGVETKLAKLSLTPPVRKHFYTQLVTYFINTLGDREGSKVAKFKNKGDL